VTQRNGKADKSNIRQFPAIGTKENLYRSDVKNAGTSPKKLHAELEDNLSRANVSRQSRMGEN
jgi:hypothetical protein